MQILSFQWICGIAEEMRISLNDVKIYSRFEICNSPKKNYHLHIVFILLPGKNKKALR